MLIFTIQRCLETLKKSLFWHKVFITTVFYDRKICVFLSVIIYWPPRAHTVDAIFLYIAFLCHSSELKRLNCHISTVSDTLLSPNNACPKVTQKRFMFRLLYSTSVTIRDSGVYYSLIGYVINNINNINFYMFVLHTYIPL